MKMLFQLAALATLGCLGLHSAAAETPSSQPNSIAAARANLAGSGNAARAAASAMPNSNAERTRPAPKMLRYRTRRLWAAAPRRKNRRAMRPTSRAPNRPRYRTWRPQAPTPRRKNRRAMPRRRKNFRTTPPRVLARRREACLATSLQTPTPRRENCRALKSLGPSSHGPTGGQTCGLSESIAAGLPVVRLGADAPKRRPAP